MYSAYVEVYLMCLIDKKDLFKFKMFIDLSEEDKLLILTQVFFKIFLIHCDTCIMWMKLGLLIII